MLRPACAKLRRVTGKTMTKKQRGSEMGLAPALELLIRLLSTVDAVLLFEPDAILQRKILRQAWLHLGRRDGTQLA